MGSIAADGVTITVEVAFATANPLTPSPSWTDVSAYVRGISTRRGKWQVGTQISDIGTASIRLDNTDRRFDPLHTGGAYYPNVLPMKQVRISAVYASTTYRLWRGFIQEWPQTWRKGNAGTAGLGADGEVTVTAVDALSILGNVELTDRYAMEVLTDNPVGYWRCDDPGNDMADAGADGFNGAWFGATEQSQQLRLLHSGARRLDGTNQDILDIATRYNESTGSTGEQEIQPGGALDGSLECWMQIPAVSQGGVQYYEFGLGPAMAIVHDSTVYNPGTPVFTWQNVGATVEGWVPISAPPSEPLHIVGTYDDSADSATLYVNGVSFGLGPGTFGSWEPLNLLAPGIFVFNGVPQIDDDGSRAFWISDIALYDTVLSQERILAHYLVGKSGARLERSGDRISAILDYIDWPGLRIIGDGDSWLDVGPLPGDALGYLQQIVDTEQGRLYVSGVGEVVFRDRTDNMQRASSTTSQATFGDSGSDLRYADLVLDGGHIDSIRNEVTVNPQSGLASSYSSSVTTDANNGLQFEINGRGTVRPITVSSTVRDSASVTAYGRRAEVMGSLHSNQPDARNLALWRLDQFSEPQVTVRQLIIQPRRSPTTLFPQVLDREIGNRITVNRHPQGVGSTIAQAATIEGIAHEFDAPTQAWTTTWFLCEPVPSYSEGNYWRVGDATYGQAGVAAVPY